MVVVFEIRNVCPCVEAIGGFSSPRDRIQQEQAAETAAEQARQQIAEAEKELAAARSALQEDPDNPNRKADYERAEEAGISQENLPLYLAFLSWCITSANAERPCSNR